MPLSTFGEAKSHLLHPQIPIVGNRIDPFSEKKKKVCLPMQDFMK
jgi:hypothetical protein